MGKKSNYKGYKAGISSVCLQTIKNQCGQISKRQTGENATRGKMRWAGGHIMQGLIKYRAVFGISSKDHWGVGGT